MPRRTNPPVPRRRLGSALWPAVALVVCAGVSCERAPEGAQEPAAGAPRDEPAPEVSPKPAGQQPPRVAADPAAPADPMLESLRELLRGLRRAQVSRDVTTAEGIAKGLYPDEARLRSALRPGVDDAVVRRIAEMHRQFAARGWSEMLGADDAYTEVLVFGATGASIARGGEAEFDRRAQGVATTILRPEMRYYVAVFVPPGETLGQKFHLFFHDGQRWGLLGPIWLVLRPDSGRA